MRAICLVAVTIFSIIAILPAVPAQAMNGCCGSMHPYGNYCEEGMWGPYGARKPVKTVSEARQILQHYYGNSDMRVGTISDQKEYFRAEIRDSRGEIADIVIIDKRSGRIRSVN